MVADAGLAAWAWAWAWTWAWTWAWAGAEATEMSWLLPLQEERRMEPLRDIVSRGCGGRKKNDSPYK